MNNWRRYLPAVIPATIGAYLVAMGSGTRDFVFMVAAFSLALLVLFGVDPTRPAAKVTAWVVNLLSATLSWIAGLFLVIPVWLFSLVTRRGGLRSGSGRGWVRAGGPDDKGDTASRTFSGDVQIHRSSPMLNFAAVVGVIAIAVAGDLGVGIVWNNLTNSGERSVPGAIRIDETEFNTDPPPDGVSPHPPDAREDGPAMRRYPWAHDYFQEFQSAGTAFWPFTIYRPFPFKGRYLNVKGWERLSYEPGVDASSVPVVAFLGGSAMYGEGQRDEFTIASYVARIAESEGIPVRVRNFGQRGWVMWQEMTLYEQLLGAGDHFDMSVFYDGANDMTVQAGPVTGVPTHYDVTQFAEQMASGGRVSSAELPRSIYDWWSSRSVVMRVISKIRGQGDAPAKDHVDPAYKNIEGSVERGVDVYRRGRVLTQSLSREHGVTDFYFWQPQDLHSPELDEAGEKVGAPTVSLTTALDGHRDVYLDNVHTNEEGARLIAEAMWPTLKPKVQAWYDDHGPARAKPRG